MTTLANFLGGNNGGKSVLKCQSSADFLGRHIYIATVQRAEENPCYHIHYYIAVQSVEKHIAASLVKKHKIAELKQPAPPLQFGVINNPLRQIHQALILEAVCSEKEIYRQYSANIKIHP